MRSETNILSGKANFFFRVKGGGSYRPEALQNLGCYVVVEECRNMTLVFPGRKQLYPFLGREEGAVHKV